MLSGLGEERTFQCEDLSTRKGSAFEGLNITAMETGKQAGLWATGSGPHDLGYNSNFSMYLFLYLGDVMVILFVHL